jgi:hypothetical protein
MPITRRFDSCCTLASVLLLLGLTLIPVAAGNAQGGDTTRAKPRPQNPPTSEACCRVARVDTSAGIVTARETATGYTFRFRVTNRRLLTSIKVADKVWADFLAKGVKLSAADSTWCCAIIAAPPDESAGDTSNSANRPQRPPVLRNRGGFS